MIRRARPGGNGAPFDWRTLLGVTEGIAFVLSGGLTPDNVAEAVRLTGADQVDVSSGVERAPGEKDPDKIERDLMHLIPKKRWFDFTYVIIDHGRSICVARKPLCAECPVNDLCPSSLV